MKNFKYPLYDVTPFSSIKEMVELAQINAADKIVYKFKSDSEICEITFAQFIDTFTCLGAFLHKEGLSGKHIACIGANSYDWIVSYFTVLRSSGVFVPIDKDLPQKDILYLLHDCEASVVFCDSGFEDLFRTYEKELSDIKLFIVFGRKENEGKFLSFDKCITAGKALDKTGYLKEKSDPDSLKLLVYTSGTTGKAKGVMLSEHNLVSSIYYGLMVSTVYDTGLSILPYHHTYEAVSDILVSFHHHSTLCINDNLQSMMKNFKIYKPSYVYIVPAIAESIYKRIKKIIQKEGNEEQFSLLINKSNELRRNEIDKRREFFGFIHEIFGGRLKKIVCGGAPIRPEVAEFFDNTGFDFINGYGITECSPLVCVNHDLYNDFRTAGIRLPCLEWRIDCPDENGTGEICVKGDVVMMGYYKRPDLTAEVLNGSWFHTGDYGYITEEDKLVITGRKKNVIVLSNGKNIFPEEIEGYIKDIGYINEVVVCSEKNNNGIEKSLMAEVFLAEEKSPVEVLQNIRTVCAFLPVYKQISKVVIRDKEFPKTSSNKIKRF